MVEVVNQLIQGDCLEVLDAIAPNSVDLVCTDPPYFLPVNSYVGARGEGYHKRSLADMSILKGYFTQVFEKLNRVLKPTGTFYVFCDAQSYPIFYQTMYPYCEHVRVIVWDKICSYNGFTWRHQHELIAWGEKEKAPRVATGDGDVIKLRGVMQADRNHPAEKPVLLLTKLIAKVTKSGDMVLDPFMGSGSTCVAAHQLDRRYIGIEFDEEYISTAKKRLAGQSSKLELFIQPEQKASFNMSDVKP
jgi:site-specific DNA-methyltransferase (adenine-specific)